MKKKKEEMKQKAKLFAAKKIFHVDIIEAVATDCLAAGFMGDIDQWMQQREAEFEQASAGSDPTGMSGSMYTMQQTGMHKEFKAFVDANMSKFVQKHKKNVEQFFEMCAKVSGAAPQVQAFIDLLTAASEFEIFVEMMSNRDKREYFFYIMRSWRSELDRAKMVRSVSRSTEASQLSAGTGAGSLRLPPVPQPEPESTQELGEPERC